MKQISTIDTPKNASIAAHEAGFSALPLSDAMLANLDRLGYHTMTLIQAASLPVALIGKDLIAQAKTSSGIANAAVFPLPVFACAMRSFPMSATGRLAA